MKKQVKFLSPDTKAIKSDTKSSAETDIFPVVGIGASAGGLNAFTQLLHALPVNTGMAFILAQHLDPKHASLLPELMTRVTVMPVIEASDGLHIERNHIYVMPSTHSLTLLNGVLHLIQRPEGREKYLPIDDFLNSLAQDRKNSAIGVILSGVASDGTLGLQAIKSAGGITFAQSEGSCEFSDMPHNAITAGHVDFILTPEEIARKLALIAHYPYLKYPLLNVEPRATIQEDEELKKIFLLLHEHNGIDFTNYKRNTILRRVKRRMTVHQLDRMIDYIKFLQIHPQEQDKLFKDMLINVTSFFRDPETIEALKKEVFPQIIQQNSNEKAIRIWIPACSTGEEAYSVAIALFEFLGIQANTVYIQIFASDIDKQSIDKARQGIYSQSIDGVVSSERLQQFFVKKNSSYQICQAIRDVCVFAVQNALEDPPFSRLNLICCRNLMIYFSINLQKKILQIFYYALRPNSFLMLGASETIGSETNLFSLVDKKNKIYICKPNVAQPRFRSTQPSYTERRFPEYLSDTTTKSSAAVIVQHTADDIILRTYAPPSVIIDQSMQIHHFRGQTNPYIEPSTGGASLNLLKMARQELVMELRVLVRKAITENCSMRKEGIRISYNNTCKYINLQVTPLFNPEVVAPYYLIVFEPVVKIMPQSSNLSTEVKNKDANGKTLYIKELKDELAAEREYMQSIIEEREEINEELQSANEEVLSTNEELTAIIEEHDSRYQELSVLNKDLTNFLVSIDIAIVILHNDLIIQRFTPLAKPLLNLLDADIGKSIENIRPNVNIPDFKRHIQQVMKTALIKTLEVQDTDGHWYDLRINPCWTQNNHVSGVVIVLIDIDSIKRHAEQLSKALQHEKRLAAMIRDSNDAVTVQDFLGHILAWNEGATKIFGYNEKESLLIEADTLIPDELLKEMHACIEQLKQGENVAPFKTKRRAKDGRLLNVWMTISLLLDEMGKPYAMIITERELT